MTDREMLESCLRAMREANDSWSVGIPSDWSNMIVALETHLITNQVTDIPTFVFVGNVTGYDETCEQVLVEWCDKTPYDSREGTLLFVRLWTQTEIDSAHKRGEELYRGFTEKSDKAIETAVDQGDERLEI